MINFISQLLDLIFSLKKFALEVVLFASCDAHSMLNIAEIKALTLKLLAGLNDFFCLVVQFILHVI